MASRIGLEPPGRPEPGQILIVIRMSSPDCEFGQESDLERQCQEMQIDSFAYANTLLCYFR